MTLELIQSLRTKATTKIVQLVMDGLGGAPRALDGRTELEAARTPNLDALAARSSASPSRSGWASPRAAGRLTWRFLGTIRSSMTSGGAFSRRSGLALSSSRKMWQPAATFAAWTSRAASPTGGLGASPRR